MKKYILVAVNAKYIHSNLAVYCLRAYAASKGRQTEIAEYTINQLPDMVLQDLYEKQADMAAFSCYIWNIDYIERLIRNYKKVSPKTKLWLGGPEAAYRAKELLTRYPELSGIMIGEGEETYERLLAYYEGETTLDTISGIAYRREENASPEFSCPEAQGEQEAIVINPSGKPLDFSRLPFPYGDGSVSASQAVSLKNWENRIIYYETSRGCPFSCSYCLSSLEKTVRFRDMELVKQELLFFIEKRVPQVKLIDRTFNCNAKRTEEILNFLTEHDNGITNFHFEVAADLLTEEQIRILNGLRRGQVQLEIGVQSFHEQTLRLVSRTTSLEKIKEKVAKIRQVGNVHIHLDLIAGLPEENLATFRNSFNEVFSMQPHQLQLGFLKLLHGSRLKEEASEYEMVYRSEPPYEILATKWLSYGEMIKLKEVEEIVEVYYNSGQFMNSLQYLLHFYESAFDFFAQLALFYKRMGYDKISHTRLQRYEILLAFAKEKEILGELLWYDACLREKPKARPSFAEQHQLTKQELRELCEQNGIRKESEGMYRLEKFSFMPEQTAKNGIKTGAACMILFSYEHREPMFGQVEVTVL